MTSDYPHWIEISRSALLHNLHLYHQAIGPSIKIMAMVKANAYGHGLTVVSPLISPEVDYFAVNTMEEALAIRQLKITIPVLVASPIPLSQLHLASQYKISLCVPSLDYLKLIVTSNLSLTTHLKVNTGTNRLGVAPDEVATALKMLQNTPITVAGVYTHFHSSDSGSPATRVQLDLFLTAVSQVKSAYPAALAHCASSSAALLLSDSRLDMIRLGLGLYGLWPDPYVARHSPKVHLHPVLSWYCRPLQIREISPGATVSYSATYTAVKPTIMAVLPIGYSDGYDRGLSNTGQVWVNNHFCPVIGRVAMNFTMVDISGLMHSAVLPSKSRAENQRGIESSTNLLQDKQLKIELLGPHITAESIAAKLDTINYEIVSRLSPLIPRIVGE